MLAMKAPQKGASPTLREQASRERVKETQQQGSK